MGKKILISSIPSWNQKKGSNTWSSLFSFAKSEDVANIYIDATRPDSNVASRYFNINETAVIKSVILRKTRTGWEVEAAPTSIANKQPNKTGHSSLLTKLKRNRCRLLLWMREFCWLVGKWKSEELNQFIEDFNPEIFIYSIESYPYFNRINEYLIEKIKPRKVVAYLWDDNFTYKQFPHSFLSKIERYFLRRQVRRLIAKSTHVLAISPKMKEECDAEFGINSTIITKPILNASGFESYTPQNPIRILYTGKLIIGRDATIAKVAHAIKLANQESTKIILDIYTTTELTDEMRKKIECSDAIRIHPSVIQSKVLELQKEADVLLFVESLSDKNLTARLSFSTKLTDYFAAGKCIWPVGNEDLGPISYIKMEDAGITSSSEAEINRTAKKFAESPRLIEDYARKSFECGIRNHNAEDILLKLENIITK